MNQRQIRKYLESYHLDKLSINLEVEVAPSLVTFCITFLNDIEDELKLIFDNNNDQIERSNIFIHNMSGEEINFESRTFRRSDGDFYVIAIPSASQWTYKLKGEMNGTSLKFPGATYPLVPGETYRVEYRYPFDKTKQHKSNTADWTVPRRG